MKHHKNTTEPKSFLQGEEFEVLNSYVSSYMGALRSAEIETPSTKTKFIYGGEGPTVVLLHGIGSKKSHFRSTMKALVSLGHKVIAPDVPGIYPKVRLKSEKHNFRNLSQWLAEFTSALGIQQYTLLGNSISASLAAYHAERYPKAVNKLILLSMPATFNADGDDLKAVIVTLLLGLNKVEDVDEIVSHCFFVPPQLPRIIKRKIYSDISTNQEFLEKLLTDIRESQVQLSNKLKRIKAPTLLISGEEDPICPADFNAWIESQIPHSELHIVGKSKHLTFIERHRLVTRLISDFIHPEKIQQPIR